MTDEHYNIDHVIPHVTYHRGHVTQHGTQSRVYAGTNMHTFFMDMLNWRTMNSGKSCSALRETKMSPY